MGALEELDELVIARLYRAHLCQATEFEADIICSLGCIINSLSPRLLEMNRNSESPQVWIRCGGDILGARQLSTIIQAERYEVGC